MSRSNKFLTLQIARAHALVASTRVAKWVKRLLDSEGYHGPVCVAGGYCRDLALLRDPKDLNVFVSSDWADLVPVLGVNIAVNLRGQWLRTSDEVFAPDVEGICRITLDETAWADRSFIPDAINIVILKSESMLDLGYVPGSQVTEDCSFMQACLARADLRLNSLGACSVVSAYHPEWDDDAYHQRLVVQHRCLTSGEPLKRIEDRLRAFTTDKFVGWDVRYEGPHGELLTEWPPRSQ